jgi:hypothetical protein
MEHKKLSIRRRRINWRYRKKRIVGLHQNEGRIEGPACLKKKYIINYYKNHFGAPHESTLALDENQIGDIHQFD